MNNTPKTMKAVVTTGTGGYEKLSYRDVPTPVPSDGELLVEVLAAGMNNTEINTRLGWYSSSVTDATNTLESVDPETDRPDGGWSAPTPFPFIQGTDCCGRVVAVGKGSAEALMGKRILVRSCMRPNGFENPETLWMGSDFDGAFAQYVTVPAGEVFAVESDWSDTELATLPCASGTAENMLHRAGVRSGETVLITGASGGVGSAAVMLAKRRGARVIALTGEAKAAAVRAAGADEILIRSRDASAIPELRSVDVVVDNVVGEGFLPMIRALRRRGRYVSSGAIGGPVVQADLRDIYLNDITLLGCTGWDEPVFPNLIRYVESSEIRPLLAGVFPLNEIADAQRRFLKKEHVGKFVLLPPKREQVN
jgi:NADPH:quinone reductase-like Zn-dependent oxidoreductase